MRMSQGGTNCFGDQEACRRPEGALGRRSRPPSLWRPRTDPNPPIQVRVEVRIEVGRRVGVLSEVEHCGLDVLGRLVAGSPRDLSSPRAAILNHTHQATVRIDVNEPAVPFGALGLFGVEELHLGLELRGEDLLHLGLAFRVLLRVIRLERPPLRTRAWCIRALARLPGYGATPSSTARMATKYSTPLTRLGI